MESFHGWYAVMSREWIYCPVFYTYTILIHFKIMMNYNVSDQNINKSFYIKWQHLQWHNRNCDSWNLWVEGSLGGKSHFLFRYVEAPLQHFWQVTKPLLIHLQWQELITCHRNTFPFLNQFHLDRIYIQQYAPILRVYGEFWQMYKPMWPLLHQYIDYPVFI